MSCKCGDEPLWEDIITTDDDDVAGGGGGSDNADTGTPDDIVDRLKVYLENKFLGLSRVFNSEGYVIPDTFEYSVVRDVDYDYVYLGESSDEANQRYIVTLAIGKAKYKLVGNEAILQRKVFDAMNGMVMLLKCGLETVE